MFAVVVVALVVVVMLRDGFNRKDFAVFVVCCFLGALCRCAVVEAFLGRVWC